MKKSIGIGIGIRLFDCLTTYLSIYPINLLTYGLGYKLDR